MQNAIGDATTSLMKITYALSSILGTQISYDYVIGNYSEIILSNEFLQIYLNELEIADINLFNIMTSNNLIFFCFFFVVYQNAYIEQHFAEVGALRSN
jgi:hypothetical protein